MALVGLGIVDVPGVGKLTEVCFGAWSSFEGGLVWARHVDVRSM